LSHEFGSIFELPQDVDVIQCFHRPVKTSCGYVNMAKNATKPHWIFFPVETTSLHESLEGLNSSLAYSGGELRPYPNWVFFTPG